jgi:hypothetical protein
MMSEPPWSALRLPASRKPSTHILRRRPKAWKEGRWDNVVYWQWAQAGKPEKIGVGQHPARPAAFARFHAEWLERNAIGQAMTMTIQPPRRQRYGKIVG